MDSKPKVLILCNDFPPINSIGAERPYSWYKYFHEFDLNPVVITKNWISDGNTSINEVDNFTSNETTKYGSIIRTRKRTLPSIWFRNKFKEKLGIIRKGLTFSEKILSFSSGTFDQHYNIYREAKNYIHKNEVKFIITTGEPFVLFRYGCMIQNEFGIKWIADYRDGWYLNHTTGIQKNLFTKIMRRIELHHEKRLVTKATQITTIDPFLAGGLSKLLNKKVDVVYNGFWKYYEPIEKPKIKSDKLIFNHTGTLTTGQNIEILLNAILELYLDEKINERNFELNLIGLEYFPEQMKRLIPYNTILNKVVFTTPRLPKERAVQMNLQADYLVNFTEPNYCAIYAKTYNYIACKKPILVLPGDGNILEDLIKENHLGFVLNSTEDIKEFILKPKTNHIDSYSNKEDEVDRISRKENFSAQQIQSKLDFFKRHNQAKIFAERIKQMDNK